MFWFCPPFISIFPFYLILLFQDSPGKEIQPTERSENTLVQSWGVNLQTFKHSNIQTLKTFKISKPSNITSPLSIVKTLFQWGLSSGQPTRWSGETNGGRAFPSHTFCPGRLEKTFHRKKVTISIPTVAASAEQNLIGGAVGLAGGGLCQLEVGGKISKQADFVLF